MNKEKVIQAISDDESESYQTEFQRPKKSNRPEANMGIFPIDENKDTKLDTPFEGKETPKNNNYPKQKDNNLSRMNKDKDNQAISDNESESYQTESPRPKKSYRPEANMGNFPLDENMGTKPDTAFEGKETP